MKYSNILNIVEIVILSVIFCLTFYRIAKNQIELRKFHKVVKKYTETYEKIFNFYNGYESNGTYISIIEKNRDKYEEFLLILTEGLKSDRKSSVKDYIIKYEVTIKKLKESQKHLVPEILQDVRDETLSKLLED